MFSWSGIQTAETLILSRALRFRPEWRDAIVWYFGLEPGMYVLEVACGPGILAPYLAGGIQPGGQVLGVDLDAAFVKRAQEMAPADGTVTYQVGDAYSLPFPTGVFDAAVSYTGVGVLADPDRAVAEMQRVVRENGTIAVAEAVSGPFGFRFPGCDGLPGPTPYPEAARYWDLRQRLMAAAEGARPPGIGSPRWPPLAIPALLAAAGVQDLVVNAWGYVTASDDDGPNGTGRGRVSLERDVEAIATATREDPTRHGLLSEEEWTEWDLASKARRAWVECHRTYAYEAGLSVVVRGINREKRS